MEIIDTHAHIYSADESVYPMKKDPLRPPEATGHIQHLRRECEINGIAGVALVQTGSAYEWDNRLLADTAVANADWTRGVCTLDPMAEDSSVTEALRTAQRSDNGSISILPFHPA